MPGVTTILFVGDVVGRAGRRACASCCPALREELGVDFVVVNGENAAGGIGITPKTAEELFAAGADAITLGNHTYRHRDVCRYLDEEPRIVRPRTTCRSQPGRGTTRRRARRRLARRRQPLRHRPPARGARRARRRSTTALREVARADHVLVDMHAEATSEKVAMGWYLDGRVTAVVGTHTHVPTADARVLPGGTAYITDVGMTGARGGVIGVKKEQSIAVMRTRHAGALRAVGGRPVAQRRAHPLRPQPRRADVDRPRCCDP